MLGEGTSCRASVTVSATPMHENNSPLRNFSRRESAGRAYLDSNDAGPIIDENRTINEIKARESAYNHIQVENEVLFEKLISTSKRRELILEEHCKKRQAYPDSSWDTRRASEYENELQLQACAAKNVVNINEYKERFNHFIEPPEDPLPLAKLEFTPVRSVIKDAVPIIDPYKTVQEKKANRLTWDDMTKTIESMKKEINERIATGGARQYICQSGVPIKSAFECRKPIRPTQGVLSEKKVVTPSKWCTYGERRGVSSEKKATSSAKRTADSSLSKCKRI